MKLILRLFGTFDAVLDGTPLTRFEANTARALLVYLALNPETAFRRETLAALLWPEQDTASALHALRQALNRLRTVLREREARVPFLDVTQHTIQLNPQGDVWVDTTVFGDLVQRTQTHPHRRRAVCRACQSLLEEAVALYQGDVLAGFHLDSVPFEEWLLVQREQLHQHAMAALFELADACLRRGDYARARQYARRQLALESWREEAHQQILRALALDGQRSAALAHYATCERVLADELGVAPSRETQQLYTAIREERPLPGLVAPPHHVPAQFTPFIGRVAALQNLIAQVNAPDCRLLSLVGPGGAGKTRLALALAEAVRGDFADGIVFAPLATVSAPALILAALAHALDLTFHEDLNLSQQVRAYLSDKELLLILDNFEHLVDGAGPVLDLLRHAPSCVCVITSRERLNAPGEWVFPVNGLSYAPDPASPPSAPQLFIASAQRLVPDAMFDADDRRAIDDICRLVDGNPLAIELAATWRRAFSCREIATEIERSFDFLEAERQGAPERHRSLRAVFAHSWALLDPEEQGALCRLAVFRGSFDREAAQQVAAVSPARLAALLDQSLLQRVSGSGGGPTRYTMHDLVQRYALEKLDAAPRQAQQARAAHARYFLTWIAAQHARLTGPEVRPALLAIEAEYGDVQAAWEWATSQADVALLDAALLGMFYFYDTRFWAAEAERVFGQAVAQLAPGETRAARILANRLRACQGYFAASREGGVERGCALLQEALTAMRALEATEHLPFALNALSRVLHHLSAYGEAHRYSSESYVLSEQLGDRYNLVLARHMLGLLDQAQGRREESLRHFQEALTLAQAARFVKLETGILRALGVSHWRCGDFTRAGEYFVQTLENCRAIGDRYGEGKTLTALGAVSFQGEDVTAADAYYQEGLHIARDIGDRRSEGITLNNLAEVQASRKHYEQASLLCRAALRIKRELSDRQGIAMTLGNLANIARRQGDDGAAEQHLNEALAIFQDLQDMRGQAMVLAVLTALAGERNQPESALAYGQAALEITEVQQQRHVYANILTNLAHALVDVGRYAEAQVHYAEALAIRQALGQAALAAEPQAGLAEVALALGDTCTALEYVTHILETHDLPALQGLDQLFRLHAVCLRVLEQAGDPRLPQLAQRVYAELQALAESIPKRALRQQFLEDITAHRVIVRMQQYGKGA